MIDAGSPIICAASRALLRPGTPTINRKVGRAVAESNSIDALMIRRSSTANVLRADK